MIVSVPLGELYFLILAPIVATATAAFVSVPSRGAIFLNAPHFYPSERQRSFRPSRGAIFLNNKENLCHCRRSKVSVPLGELYFLIPSLGPACFLGYLPFCVANCFSGNIAFFGMNFCRFSQCLCGAWERLQNSRISASLILLDSMILLDATSSHTVPSCILFPDNEYI